jgi:CAAX protease family protein
LERVIRLTIGRQSVASTSSGHGTTSRRTRAYLSNSRALSAFELLLGTAIVLGYNVFHVIPNEVPILFALGLVSVRLRNGALSAMGFKRPTSWSSIVLIALGAAALRILLGEFVIDPLTGRFWPPAAAPAEAEAITGNIKFALLALLLVWSFAAFGEEIAYRGYLLTRAADLGRRSATAYWVGMVFVSVLFGYGHFYKCRVSGVGCRK